MDESRDDGESGDGDDGGGEEASDASDCLVYLTLGHVLGAIVADALVAAADDAGVAVQDALASGQSFAVAADAVRLCRPGVDG